jgi:exocyst complex component 8
LTIQNTRRRPSIDNTALMSRGFNPEQYIASSLAGASEADIRTFYESLRELRSTTSSDLQSNVFNNYASFVSLSHEISSLTSDLSSLSSLLTQFSNLTQSLSVSIQRDESDTDQAFGYQRDRRGAQHQRNSIADLAQIHAGHLQELWHLVEGSQKFLPAYPGRHVVKESLNWTELNPATWKPTKTVHLILLNDHLLVAAKKRGNATSVQSRRSVADRCWNLTDIEINALNEDQEGQNATSGALQIVWGREVAFYAPGEGRASERGSFIQAFKRANIDLHNRRKHTESVSTKGMCQSLLILSQSGRAVVNDISDVG